MGHGNGNKPLFYHIWACGSQVVLNVLKDLLAVFPTLGFSPIFLGFFNKFFDLISLSRKRSRFVWDTAIFMDLKYNN